jgi:diguanylate cyclase (GGDEF)-like protein
MMRNYERDYRYLLLNLIPQHRLPPGLRRDVELALVSGKPEDLRRQSVIALEALCDTNYLERTGLRRTNSDVVADYKRKGGRYSLSVSIPLDEWTRYVGPRVEPEADLPPTPEVEKPSGPPPDESRAAAPAPVGNAVGADSLRYLSEITRVFSVSGRADPILRRLELLIGTLKRWLNVPALRLILLEEVSDVTDIDADWLETMSESELRDNEWYGARVETGTQRLIPRSKAPETAISDAPDEWDYIGLSPVFSMGKVCGILKMYFDRGVDEVTKKRRLEAATNLVKQTIEFNTQIETITSVDALTQIYNRHFYDTQVSVEIERAMRSGNEVSMLVIDLDDFKRINDEFGHMKGDEALIAVAELIRKNLRKVDLPFRYGGEEFVILLPGTSEFESVHTAERLRRVVAEFDGFKDLHGRTREITVSVGVSVFPNTATTADELFNQADAAMFRAKKLGKNRVVLYKQDMKLGRD